MTAVIEKRNKRCRRYSDWHEINRLFTIL